VSLEKRPKEMILLRVSDEIFLMMGFGGSLKRNKVFDGTSVGDGFWIEIDNNSTEDKKTQDERGF